MPALAPPNRTGQAPQGPPAHRASLAKRLNNLRPGRSRSGPKDPAHAARSKNDRGTRLCRSRHGCHSPSLKNAAITGGKGPAPPLIRSAPVPMSSVITDRGHVTLGVIGALGKFHPTADVGRALAKLSCTSAAKALCALVSSKTSAEASPKASYTSSLNSFTTTPCSLISLAGTYRCWRCTPNRTDRWPGWRGLDDHLIAFRGLPHHDAFMPRELYPPGSWKPG